MGNQPYRKGAFEIPCRADWAIAKAGDLERLPLWRQGRPMAEVLKYLAAFVSALPTNVRAWARSIAVGEPGMPFTKIEVHATKQ